MKRKLMGITTMVIIIFLAACNGNNDENVIKNEADDVIELNFVYTEEGETYELYKEMFKEYESENSHIKINTQTIPNEYNSTILTRIAGGNAPDVLWINNDAVAPFANRNALLDLSKYDGDLFDSSIFAENALEGFTYDGKLYGIPADSAPAVLFYNRDLFDEAGEDYPKPKMSYEELTELAEIMTNHEENKVSQYGYAQDLSWFSITSHFWQRGGDLINEDLTQSVLHSEENLEALNYLRDLMDVKKIAPSAATQETNPSYQFFTNGNAAMFYGGAWLASTELRGVNFNWDVVTPPVGEFEVNTMALGGFAVTSSTKHKEESVKFLAWLAGKEGQEIKFEQGFAGLPTVNELLDSPIAIKGFEHPDNKDIQLHYIAESAENARVNPATEHWQEFNVEANKELQLFWNGEQEAEETTKNIDEKSVEIFK